MSHQTAIADPEDNGDADEEEELQGEASQD